MLKFTGLGALALAFLATPAFAQVNLGFESGLTGWTVSGTANGGSQVVSGHGSFGPKEGAKFLRIAAGCYTNSASQTFSLAAGQSVTGHAGFDGGDYMPYNDSASVTISSATMSASGWYADISQVGNFGDKPWQAWTLTANASGSYKLVYSVTNKYDCIYVSYGLFDGGGEPPCRDDDQDGVCNDKDNCPSVANKDQANSDGDKHGNVCDNCPGAANDDQANSDADSYGDACDNCALVTNQDQANNDSDSHGDACDNCKFTANEDQANSDTDSHGNACDNCATVANEDQLNSDGDAFGNVCDKCPFDFYNDADDDGVCGDVDHCANTADSDTAAGVPSEGLNVNHFADTDGDGVFDTTLPKGKGPGKSYTIKQTAGCNCAQIIDGLALGEGHVKHGCSISAMDDWLAFIQSIGLGK